MGQSPLEEPIPSYSDFKYDFKYLGDQNLKMFLDSIAWTMVTKNTNSYDCVMGILDSVQKHYPGLDGEGAALLIDKMGSYSLDRPNGKEVIYNGIVAIGTHISVIENDLDDGMAFRLFIENTETFYNSIYRNLPS